MTLAGVPILPEVEPDRTPFWRQVVRGLSQLGWLHNEFAAVFFVTAATVFNWRLGVAMVVSVLAATIAARLLRADAKMLGLGLYGFNSALMGLALVTFFKPGVTMWVWVPVLGAVVAVVNVLMVRWLSFPVLGAPFTAVFWAICIACAVLNPADAI